MHHKTQLEQWQEQRSVHLEAVEFWFSNAENRRALSDVDRYQRVEGDLNEAERLHALCRPHERFPNDKVFLRLRAGLKARRPVKQMGLGQHKARSTAGNSVRGVA